MITGMVTALWGGEPLGMGNTKLLMLGVGAPGERWSWAGAQHDGPAMDCRGWGGGGETLELPVTL